MSLTLLVSPVIKQAIECPCGEMGHLLDLESMSLCLSLTFLWALATYLIYDCLLSHFKNQTDTLLGFVLL